MSEDGEAEEHEELYGLEALLDGLAPRLVGLERTRQRRAGGAFRGSGPVIQLAGGRSTGKTATLNVLHRDYTDRVPLVRADLADRSFGEAGLAHLNRGDTWNASPVTHLLHLLSYRLGLDVTAFPRPIRFPRLALGLLVVAAWRPAAPSGDGEGSGDGGPPPDQLPAELLASEAALRQIIAAVAAKPSERRQRLKEWTDALTPQLLALFGLPPLEGLAQLILNTAGELLAGRGDRALRWWETRLPAPHFLGDAVQRLNQFARDFRRLDARRHRAEAFLVAAFLDDITAYYGWARRKERVPRCLILLDNIHTDVGRRFLGLLLDAYPAAANAVRPVVVATALGGDPDARPLAAVAGETPRPGEGGGPWLLRLAMPAPLPEDIMKMFGTADYPDGLPEVVEGLSGGRAGCARAMVDAAVERIRTGTAPRAGELLDLPPGSGRSATVADELLRRLLPARRPRDDLTSLSAALDAAAARRLWGTLGPPDGDTRARRLRAVTDELAGTHWESTPWPWTADDRPPGSVPFVADRTLRALLLRRLATRSDQAADQAADGAAEWRQIHRRLRSGYNPRELPEHAVGHTVPYLHHALALGELDVVERGLHQRFATTEPAAWLAAVNVICAAPLPPAAIAVPAPVPAGCPVCAGGGVPAAHRAIGRLIRGVWRRSGPLAALTPRGDDIARVEAALLTLLNECPGDLDDAAYLAAWETWPEQLREGRGAPELTVRRRTDA